MGFLQFNKSGMNLFCLIFSNRVSSILFFCLFAFQSRKGNVMIGTAYSMQCSRPNGFSCLNKRHGFKAVLNFLFVFIHILLSAPNI
jgi:hypothetical protein